jgi:hypothetical protein
VCTGLEVANNLADALLPPGWFAHRQATLAGQCVAQGDFDPFMRTQIEKRGMPQRKKTQGHSDHSKQMLARNLTFRGFIKSGSRTAVACDSEQRAPLQPLKMKT